MKAKLAAAAILAVVIVAGVAGTRDEPSHEPSPARASFCQQFVKRNVLKTAGGTARFSEESETGTYPTFTVRGTVSWGPPGTRNRNQYSCTFTQEANAWRIEKATWGT